jgi:hypothetical protein
LTLFSGGNRTPLRRSTSGFTPQLLLPQAAALRSQARVKTAAGASQGLGDWTATQGGTSGASSGTSGNTTNADTLTFPTPSAGWGTVTHFGLFDAASGGNLIFWGPLTIAKTVNQADVVAFPAGSLSVTVS